MAQLPIYYKVLTSDGKKEDISFIPISKQKNEDVKEAISKAIKDLYQKEATVIKYEKLEETCIGCILNRPGQRSHQERGGCLYEDSD